jgi:lipopolysaccharide/colanic/teichoic acid biosynthesis glycosyltransferase
MAIAAAILFEGGGGVVFTQTRVTKAWSGRHDAVPGLTGEWQVMRSAKTDVEELIRFDRGYLAARSLRRDLSVLARTFVCVARGTGR